MTNNNLSTPFSLNVFLQTVGQSISLYDSPIFMKSCLGMHCIHVLTVAEFQFGFLNVYKNAFDIQILRKIYF